MNSWADERCQYKTGNGQDVTKTRAKKKTTAEGPRNYGQKKRKCRKDGGTQKGDRGTSVKAGGDPSQKKFKEEGR